MPILIAVLILALVIIIGLAWFLMRQRRSRRLKQQFGPEYGQAVDAMGSRRRGEAELDARRERVESLEIVELPAAEADAFSAEWRDVQAKFVDQPSEAIMEAETLVTRVMGRRGYPVADFEQRAADVSVDHPEVVSEYRAARVIAVANADGGASTEDLRQAMLHYRALFDELLGKRVADS